MDDNRRTAFAILLSIMVVMVYSQLTAPPPVPPASQRTAQTTAPVAPNSGQQVAQQGAPTQVNSQAPLALSELNETASTKITTERTSIEIIHLGARVRNYRLNHYNRQLDGDEKLDLVHYGESPILPLGITTGAVTDERVQYQLSAVTGADQAPDGTYRINGPEARFEFSGTYPTGGTIKKIIKVSANSFVMEVEASLDTPSQEPLAVEWAHYVPADDKDARLDPKQYALLNTEGSVQRIQLKDLPLGTSNDAGLNRWISFGDKYFMAGLIGSAEKGTHFRVGNNNQSFFVRALGDKQQVQSRIYVGPKDFEILKATGTQLERSIDLGFFSFLADPLLHLLKFFYSVLGNYGLAIILLTLSLKLLFYPLTSASFKSMSAMQELQPELKELRERVKDPQQLNQEMMALYKRRGVNPLGGCLPILIQIPVFFGLYNALLQSIELRHAPFALWIHDLSTPERLMLFGFPVPLMILLMGASMLLQQWTQPSSMDPEQKKIMMLTPVMFTVMFIIVPMPAGLVLYWLVNNIMSITQQVYLRRTKGAHPLTATITASVAIFSFAFILTLL